MFAGVSSSSRATCPNSEMRRLSMTLSVLFRGELTTGSSLNDCVCSPVDSRAANIRHSSAVLMAASNSPVTFTADGREHMELTAVNGLRCWNIE